MYVRRVLGKGEGVPAYFHCFEAVGEGHVDDLVVFDLLVGDGQDDGEEHAAIAALPLAVRTTRSLLHLNQVILHRVLEVDEVELGELVVEAVEELVDELGRQGGTSSHMVNSKLRNS